MTSAVTLYVSIVIVCVSGSVLPMEPRIFGGKPLNPNIHKYLVELHIHDETDSFGCSGSILSDRWILTAAHCVMPDKPRTIYVTHHTDGNKEVIAKIKQTFTNPSFVPDKKGRILRNDDAAHDIALLKTVNKIALDDNVNAIKLMEPEMTVTWATVVGHGLSERDDEPKEGIVRLYKCGNTSRVLCSMGSVRVARGDSGGPVVANGSIVGVTSASCFDFEINNNCQSVYVNVAENYKWIKRTQAVK